MKLTPEMENTLVKNEKEISIISLLKSFTFEMGSIVFWNELGKNPYGKIVNWLKFPRFL